MRHRNQSIHPPAPNAPIGPLRALTTMKPEPGDDADDLNPLARKIPAWARKLLKIGRPTGNDPGTIINPTKDTPITIPVHCRIWICPEGEARGHFEVYWDQTHQELVIKTHPGVIALKPHCSNRVSIVAVMP